MSETPCFHFHVRGGVRPTFWHSERRPDGGIYQTKCPTCGRYGYVSVQTDRKSTGYRLIGQGHTQASRVFNGLPIYGVLFMWNGEKFFKVGEHTYVKNLYLRGDRRLRESGLYEGYSVVPIWRADYAAIDQIERYTEEARVEAYANVLAPLYLGVTTSEFNHRLTQHLARLVKGFTDPVAAITPINLTGRLD